MAWAWMQMLCCSHANRSFLWSVHQRLFSHKFLPGTHVSVILISQPPDRHAESPKCTNQMYATIFDFHKDKLALKVSSFQFAVLEDYSCWPQWLAGTGLESCKRQSLQKIHPKALVPSGRPIASRKLNLTLAKVGWLNSDLAAFHDWVIPKVLKYVVEDSMG